MSVVIFGLLAAAAFGIWQNSIWAAGFLACLLAYIHILMDDYMQKIK